MSKKILVVDDNPTNLNVCKKTLKGLYEVYAATSVDKMFDILKQIIPDLILLDVEMPFVNGYEAMRRLKKSDEYREIPVIFLSAMDDAQSEIEGLELGAVDYIHKPFVSSLLLKRIETHMAVIDKSAGELLKPAGDGAKPGIETEEKALSVLLTRGEVLSRMAREIRAPLNTIIDIIEAAIKTDDIGQIKSSLGKAHTESRLILEILDNTLGAKNDENSESVIS